MTTITMTRKERIAQDKKKKKKGNKKMKALLTLVLASSVFVAPTVDASTEDCGCVQYTGEHVVKKGETMYSISRKNNLSVEQLMDANFTEETIIYVGQRLMIPEKNQLWYGGVVKPFPKVGDSITETHTVQKGDTLYSISKKTGISISAIKSMNALKSDLIFVGQILKITSKTDSSKVGVQQVLTTTYVVKPGETKYGLQRKFGDSIVLPKGTLKAGANLAIKGQVQKITTENEFLLADGRVIEVSVAGNYYAVNLSDGNQPIAHFAYRTDLRVTFVVVQVGLKKELVSYSVQYLN